MEAVAGPAPHVSRCDLSDVDACVAAARREGRWSLIVDPSARYDALMQYNECSANPKARRGAAPRIIDLKKMDVERRLQRKSVAEHHAELRAHLRAAIVGPRPEVDGRPVGQELFVRVGNASLNMWTLVSAEHFPRETFDFERCMTAAVLGKLVPDVDPICVDFHPRLSELFLPMLEAGRQPGPPEFQIVAWTSHSEEEYDAALRPLIPLLNAMEHIVVRHVDGVAALNFDTDEHGGYGGGDAWLRGTASSPLHAWTPAAGGSATTGPRGGENGDAVAEEEERERL